MKAFTHPPEPPRPCRSCDGWGIWVMRISADDEVAILSVRVIVRTCPVCEGWGLIFQRRRA